MKFEMPSREVIEESENLYYAAFETSDLKEREALLNQAVEVNMFNFDAHRELVNFEENGDLHLSMYRNLMYAAEQYLADVEEIRIDNEEYHGVFWGVFETRPYMRLRQAHFLELIDIGYFHQAIIEGMMTMFLNESDNLGVRYSMLPLFLVTGNMEGILDMRERFEDFGFIWDFPYVLALFDEEDFDGAKVLMKKLLEDYPYAYNILLYGEDPDEETLLDLGFGYRHKSPSEVYTRLDDLEHLIRPEFLVWLEQEFKPLN